MTLRLRSSDVTRKLFADDTKLYSMFDNALSPNRLQSCLSATLAWSDHFQITLSTSKYSVLHIRSPITRNTSLDNVSYSGQPILPCVNYYTELGVRPTCNNKLMVRPSYDNIVAKVSLLSSLFSSVFSLVIICCWLRLFMFLFGLFLNSILSFGTRGRNKKCLKLKVYRIIFWKILWFI